MINLKLSSLYPNNEIPSVGRVHLEGLDIILNIASNTSAWLIRGINKVELAKPGDISKKITGTPRVGDVYVLENETGKLIVNVEEDGEKLAVSYDSGQEYPTENLTNNVDIKLKEDSTYTKSKSTLTVGGLLLVILIISVVFGINQKNKANFTKESEKKLQTAKEYYQNSGLVLSVDKDESRRLFLESKNLVLELEKSGYKNTTLDELKNQILKSESDILGETKVEVKELSDLSLQTSGFIGNKIVSTGEDVFVFDDKNKTVIRMNQDGKGVKMFAGKDQLSGALEIASYQERLFSLNDDGIYEVKTTREKIKDKDWGDSLFYLYSGNIYLLDKKENMIYRFQGSNSGFSNKSEWLAPGVSMDLSNTKDVVIDGSIWTLSTTGKITRFTNGNPTTIQIKGLPNDLSDISSIYTNEDLKYVYLLDNISGKVVALEKDGTFKTQYISEEIKNSQDILVSNDGKKVLLLKGSKVEYFEI